MVTSSAIEIMMGSEEDWKANVYLLVSNARLTLPDIVEVDVGEEAVDTDALVLEPPISVRQQTLHQIHGVWRHFRLAGKLQALLFTYKTPVQVQDGPITWQFGFGVNLNLWT